MSLFTARLFRFLLCIPVSVILMFPILDAKEILEPNRKDELFQSLFRESNLSFTIFSPDLKSLNINEWPNISVENCVIFFSKSRNEIPYADIINEFIKDYSDGLKFSEIYLFQHSSFEPILLYASDDAFIGKWREAGGTYVGLTEIDFESNPSNGSESSP